jgi:hypothetical protein
LLRAVCPKLPHNKHNTLGIYLFTMPMRKCP